MHVTELVAQILKVLAAGLLLISFAMLAGRRTQQLITLYCLAGSATFCLDVSRGL